MELERQQTKWLRGADHQQMSKVNFVSHVRINSALDKRLFNSLQSRYAATLAHLPVSVSAAMHLSNRKATMREMQIKQADLACYARVMQDSLLRIELDIKTEQINSALYGLLKDLTIVTIPKYGVNGEYNALVNLLDRTIPEQRLNNLWLSCKKKLGPYIFDKHGALRIPSGIEKQQMNVIVDQFKHDLDLMLKDSFFIAWEVLNPSENIRPFDERFDSKIVNNQVNQDLLQVRNLCELKEYDQARTIGNKYHGWQSLKFNYAGTIADGLYRYHYSVKDKGALIEEYPQFKPRALSPTRYAIQRSILPIALNTHQQAYAPRYKDSAHTYKKNLNTLHGVYAKSLERNASAQQALREFAQTYREKGATVAFEQLTQAEKALLLQQESFHSIKQAARTFAIEVSNLQKKADVGCELAYSKLYDLQDRARHMSDMQSEDRYRVIMTTEVGNRVIGAVHGWAHPLESLESFAHVTFGGLRFGAAAITSELLGDFAPVYVRDYLWDCHASFLKAVDSFEKLPRIEKVRVMTGVAADMLLCHLSGKAIGGVANGLLNTVQGIKEIGIAVQAPEQLAFIGPVVENEVAVIGSMGKAVVPTLATTLEQSMVQEATFNSSVAQAVHTETKLSMTVEKAPKQISTNIIKSAGITEKEACAVFEASGELKELQGVTKELYTKIPDTKVISPYDMDITIAQASKLDAEAISLYDAIRISNADVASISKNTGISKHVIEQIKKHVFYEKHIIDKGITTFTPDIDMGRAWQRLTNGNFVKADIKLLEHEFAESLIMRGALIDWQTAHPLANKISNWEILIRK